MSSGRQHELKFDKWIRSVLDEGTCVVKQDGALMRFGEDQAMQSNQFEHAGARFLFILFF